MLITGLIEYVPPCEPGAAGRRPEALGVRPIHTLWCTDLDAGAHVAEQHALHDPVRVPVVDFAEAAAGDDEAVGHVEQRVELRVVADVVLHAPAQHLPQRVQLRGPAAEVLVGDAAQDGRRLGPVRRRPLLQLVAILRTARNQSAYAGTEGPGARGHPWGRVEVSQRETGLILKSCAA